jgi:diguanylate cyclase (GGDEF)-like protein
VPLVIISILMPHGQDVVGMYEGERPPFRTGIAVTVLCRQIVQSGKPVIVHDVRRRIAVGSDALAERDIASYAGVPVLLGDSAIGVVAALDRRVRQWSDRDVELLRRFAETVASVVATERALEHEREVTTLLLALAAATSAQALLEPIARHIGWPRAQLVFIEHGRVRPIAVYDADRRDARLVATSWPVDADPVVREAVRSGQPIWPLDLDGAGRDRVPQFAIAIPDRSAVLELFTGEVPAASRDLGRLAPSIAALVGAALLRMDKKGSPDRRTGELEVLALHDELTGLLNRRGFYAVAGGQLAIARRKGMAGLVLFIDVDGLKGVNDRDGHSSGDALLRLAGSVLRSTFREADTIARVGGDEFVVFSIDTTDQDLITVTDRLSTELARANASASAISQLRWSVGHVCFDGALVISLDALIVEADRRMYAIKRLTQLASSGFAAT